MLPIEIDTETGAAETPKIKRRQLGKNKTTMKSLKREYTRARFQISNLVGRIGFEAARPNRTRCHHEARHYLSVYKPS